MSYASDRGLVVGSKIKALEDSDYFSINEILTMVSDDDALMPSFRSEETGALFPFCIARKWEHYKEESKPKTPFQQAGYTTDMKFTYVNSDGYFSAGTTVWIVEDDGTECPEFTDGYDRSYSYVRDNPYGKADIAPVVGIDLAKEGSEKTMEALVSITQDTKYTVVIKGTTFIFTQDELDALAEELLGFTTL